MLYEVEWLTPMQQTAFLDGQDMTTPVVARARKSDPETSKIAAEQITKSGKIAEHHQIIAALVRQYPGLTTGELSEKTTELTHEQIWRRMSELEELNTVIHGDKRLCKVRKTMCRPWWPK